MQRISAVAVSLAATASATEASPIGKVIQMISDLQSKVINQGETAQSSYTEFSEWCEDRARELSHEIKTGTADVEDLKASIADSESTAQALSSKIDVLAGDIANDDADLKEARGVREEEHTTFKAEEAELVETIDMLGRAKSILEREMAKGSASMLQMQDAQNVASALSVMVEASMMSSADATKLTALVQSAQSATEEQPVNAPAAAVYESKSGNIVDTIEDLHEKASDQLDAARKKEMENRHNFEMLAASLEDEIRFAKEGMEKAKKGLAQANEANATATGDLQVTSKELAADTEAKGQLHQDCMNRAEDFEIETKSRGEELKALATAKKVIQEAVGDAPSFVQTAAMTTTRDLKGLEAVRMVRDLARRENSAALTQLSMRLASVGRSGAGDPFGKIKGMISDMITKLEEEAAAAATKKAHCDKELGDSNAKKDEKTAEVEKLSTTIDRNNARATKLQAQVAEFQNQLAKLETSQAEMDKMRASENAVYKEDKAEMEQGLAGVKAALKVLEEYYNQADKGHSSSDGAGASIIGLLEVCESDFSKSLAEIVSTEETAVAEYEKETKENDLERAEKSKDVEYKTREAKKLAKQATALSADRANVQEELDSVLQYLSSLEGECTDKVESYAERKARREAELAGLKEALNVLESEADTSLLQVQHLRGIKRHA